MFCVHVSSGFTASVNVLIVSQLLLPATVSVIVAAPLNTWPSHVYGNWFAQTVMFCVDVSSGFTASVNVLIVSQLLLPATVSVIVAAPLNTWPSHVYGNWFAQTVMFCVDVSSGFTASVNVLIVSQLLLPATVSVIVAAPLNTWPSHVYGNWFAQTVMFCVDVSSGFTASVNVLIVSQLLLPATVSVIVAAPLNTWPSHVYGNWFAQTVMFCVDVSSGFTASVNVLTVSQLLLPATVSVIVAAPLNKWPSHVYGNWFAQTVMFCVDVSSGFTASINVLIVSQLLLPATVSVIVAAPL